MPARLWTSTLKRTIDTAQFITHPVIEVSWENDDLNGVMQSWVQMRHKKWTNLDEIYAGICDGEGDVIVLLQRWAWCVLDRQWMPRCAALCGIVCILARDAVHCSSCMFFSCVPEPYASSCVCMRCRACWRFTVCMRRACVLVVCCPECCAVHVWRGTWHVPRHDIQGDRRGISHGVQPPPG